MELTREGGGGGAGGGEKDKRGKAGEEGVERKKAGFGGPRLSENRGKRGRIKEGIMMSPWSLTRGKPWRVGRGAGRRFFPFFYFVFDETRGDATNEKERRRAKRRRGEDA